MNLNSCDTIPLIYTAAGTFDRTLDIHAQARQFWRLSNVSFTRRYRTFRRCRDRNTRGVHARDQMLENNDEAGPRNAYYYLHFLSRRDARGRGPPDAHAKRPAECVLREQKEKNNPSGHAERNGKKIGMRVYVSALSASPNDDSTCQ